MDVAVVGLGAMGSAVAAHLAGRGHAVVGFDRYAPPHDRGSSHGRSRIIRQAYFEDPAYVPLVLRAYELWRALEHDTGRRLLAEVGGLMVGRPDSEIVAGTIASAQRHHLDHEVLGADEVAARHPAIAVGPDEVAVWEPRAGVLAPEDCVYAHLEVAAARGADLRTDTAVLGWREEPGAVVVETGAGAVRADRLVVAAGAWISELTPLETTVERMAVAWFDAPDATTPIFIADADEEDPVYGIPGLRGEGYKVALHHGGRTGDPDTLPRTVAREEIDRIAAAGRRRVPGLGAPTAATTCLYTNSPDGHFLVGPLPGSDRVVVAGGFSGHGFKFASVVGEVTADLVEDAPPRHDVAMFAPGRALREGRTESA